MSTNLVPNMYSRRLHAMMACLKAANLTRGINDDLPCEVLPGEWYMAPVPAKVFVHRMGGPVHYGMGNQSGEAYIRWQVVAHLTVPGTPEAQEEYAGIFSANILAACAGMAKRDGLVYGWKSLKVLPGSGLLRFADNKGQRHTVEVFLLEMMFGVAMPDTITLPADSKEPAD